MKKFVLLIFIFLLGCNEVNRNCNRNEVYSKLDELTTCLASTGDNDLAAILSTVNGTIVSDMTSELSELMVVFSIKALQKISDQEKSN